MRPEWAASDGFPAFLANVSALGHFGELGRALDRIDNDADNEPGNVRWATRSQQNLNKRGTPRGERGRFADTAAIMS